jgi:hypothetical protein
MLPAYLLVGHINFTAETERDIPHKSFGLQRGVFYNSA